MDPNFSIKIVEESNLYALQYDSNKPLDFDQNKREQFIVMVFLISIRLNFIGIQKLDYGKMADMNAFETIKRNL
ncbi:hypothetical protein RRG08_038481 [Elysia crispata]|uniref:Uncharacterized protein n=1 Tax=Elysia crispata TaxID=231223 RepID=A0AAE0XS09_9GAST|nr:hypothetical protein RRG08_038481 [Elysia crispata]